MLTVRIQEKNYSESIMVLKLKDGYHKNLIHIPFSLNLLACPTAKLRLTDPPILLYLIPESR